MRYSGLAALFATVASAGGHQELQHAVHPRDILNIGPSGVCPAFPTITAELQPVAYNEFFPYTTVIFPFRNGVPFTVSNAPTDVRITSTFTYLITPSTVPTASSPAASSPTASNPTAANPTPSNPTPSNPTPSNPTPSNPTPSNPTPSNPTPSNPTTSSPIASNTTTDLTIGQGLPTGITGSLADETFVFLAFSNYPRATPVVGRRQENMRRQEASATQPINAVNLAQPTSLLPGGLSQDNCDSASPFLLRQGRLVQYAFAVGKMVFEIAPLLGLTLAPPPDQVNTTFSLNNGVLEWIAVDLNEDATFYDCGGLLYAGFDTIPSLDCIPVIIGAIAGSACIDRVQQTRAPNPTFVAPIPASTSSPTTITVPSTSTPSFTSTSTIPASTSNIMSSSLDSDLTTSTTTVVSSSASPPASSSTGLSSLQVSPSTSSFADSSSPPSSASSSPSSSASSPASPSSSQSSTMVPVTSDSTTTDTSITTTATPDTSTITTVTTTDTTPTTTTTTATTTSRRPACSELPNPYTADNGDRFSITCGVIYSGGGEGIITSLVTPDFVTCINVCSTTPNCILAEFNSAVSVPCTLFSETDGTNAEPYGQLAELIS